MLGVVKEGRFSDRKFEAVSGGDQELSLEDMPDTAFIMSNYFHPERK